MCTVDRDGLGGVRKNQIPVWCPPGGSLRSAISYREGASLCSSPAPCTVQTVGLIKVSLHAPTAGMNNSLHHFFGGSPPYEYAIQGGTNLPIHSDESKSMGDWWPSLGPLWGPGLARTLHSSFFQARPSSTDALSPQTFDD